MAEAILKEIRQTKPTASPEEEACLNVLRAAEFLSRSLNEWLRDVNLTSTQYNVLRILRGAGEPGLPCKEIAGRMITTVPDVTRLLDRMERKGWLVRTRGKEDRRVVLARITARGKDLADRLDGGMAAWLRRQLKKLSSPEVQDLIRLLEKIRGH